MMSNHASQRMQQRAIHLLMIDLLYRYGREQHQNGSTLLFLVSRARKQARRALEEVKQRFEKLCDTYLVESEADGVVITVGHRSKRVRNY
jgi:hypothetical protein